MPVWRDSAGAMERRSGRSWPRKRQSGRRHERQVPEDAAARSARLAGKMGGPRSFRIIKALAESAVCLAYGQGSPRQAEDFSRRQARDLER